LDSFAKVCLKKLKNRFFIRLLQGAAGGCSFNKKLQNQPDKILSVILQRFLNINLLLTYAS
jgi:hypothetical protein